MLNRSASLAMSTSILKALPGKLDVKRHSPSILYMSDREFVTSFLSFMIDTLLNVCLRYQSNYVVVQLISFQGFNSHFISHP